jgi:hypothetical protein
MTRDPAQAGGGGAVAFVPDANYGASGTFSNGQIVTITSALNAFDVKPNGVKPAWYWDVGRTGSTSLDPLSRNTSWQTNTGNGPQFGSIQTDVLATNSVANYRVTAPNAGQAAVIDGMPLTFTDMYLFAKWRTDFNYVEANASDGLSWNLKGWRVWGGGVGGSGHDLKTGYGDLEAGQNNDNPVLFYEFTDGGSNHDGWGMGLPKNVWLTQEYHLFQGTVNGNNTSTKVYEQGQLVTTYTGAGRTSGWPDAFDQLFAHQFEGLDGTSSMHLYYDCIYVDDSLSRVMVSDAPTWSTASTRALEIQIPTAWATNAISFYVRQGALPSFTGKYLYVIKNNGSDLRIGQFVAA